MTMAKLTAGDGYTYLTRNIAGGDVARERGQAAADYYTAKGNPAGRWMGHGAALLGLEGAEVTEEQMMALFGQGMHPDADRMVDEYLQQHVRAGMTERQLRAVQAEAIRHATLGRRFPAYQALEDFGSRVDRRLKVIEQETGRAPTATDLKRVQAEEAKRARAAVAGFDLVFAPVKSAALVWALDPRPEVRRAVREAHEAARDSTLTKVEREAAFTRRGTGGVAQIETNGLICAVFDHYDSRNGDPNLHTHVAISSKVQGVDGKWRSLDARTLYAVKVAMSESYNTAFEVELRARLPVRFTTRHDTREAREPIREIAGVRLEWITHYSSRRTQIEARYQQLVRGYRREHGYDPSTAICHQLARQANLETRQGKKAARSLEEMRTDWLQTFTETFGQRAIGELMALVPDVVPDGAMAAAHSAGTSVSPADIEVLAEHVVRSVAEMRSTWTVWNLRAEAERLARVHHAFTSPVEHETVVNAVVARTLSPELAVGVDQPSPVDEPALLRRSDGASLFVPHGSQRFTSRLVLDAEDRLVAAARTHTAVGLSGIGVDAALDGFDAQLAALGMRLDAGQRHLVRTFATDTRLLVAGLGPAGAGKTTAMRAYKHVAQQAGQRILPLATSAAAAEVLGSELGMATDNLHKFLTEYTTGRYARELTSGQWVPSYARLFALQPGDVVLLDEAGMAGTLLLDQLVSIASRRGAVVRLLGDYRQLGSVESGGALRLICHEVGAAELTTLYRFADPDEAEATLKMRVGDSAGLDFYFQNGRVKAGSKPSMIEAAYAGWKADMLAGKTTMMAAATNLNVTELSAQARRDRVEAAQVEPDGVTLHDGNLAGVGDWIITRNNQRRLRTGRGDWVKNGDGWRVTARHGDGSLTVKHLGHGGFITLPTPYVASDVELLYAATTNREQGATVDTAHPLITPDMTRENLYVISTRARETTTLYVVTHELLAFDPDDRLDRVRTDARQYVAREVLENVLAREGNQISATETLQQAADEAVSLRSLVPRHQHGTNIVATDRYTYLAHQVLPRPLAHTLTSCESWSQTVAALASAEHIGWPAVYLLRTVARDGDLLTADTPGRLVAWRINALIDARPTPAPMAKPTLADTTRYAALLASLLAAQPAAPSLDPQIATRPPALLGGKHAGNRSSFVSSDDLAAYATTTADALGLPVAQVTAHRAWPHLAAVLAAAHRSGRDVPGLVGPLAAQLTRTQATGAETDAARPDQPVIQLSRQVRRLLEADPTSSGVTMPYQLRHAITAAAALGSDTATTLRGQPGWGVLDAALRRAEHAGHDPAAMLRRVAESRDYQGVDDPAKVLAWRLHRCLHTQPIPEQDLKQSSGPVEWPTVAWTLKALENTGIELHELLNDNQPRTLNDVLQLAHRTGNQRRTAHQDTSATLPWTNGAPPAPDHELAPYLTDLDQQIAIRVRRLAETTLTTRPDWSLPLGTAPHEPAVRAEWERHVAIVAAYRDQAAVTTNDPRQILGPYSPAASPEHTAYWHAVTSVHAARQLAGLQPAPQSPTPETQAHAHTITDLYLSLPEQERGAVQTILAERGDGLWFGDRAALDDHAVTHPSNIHELQQALVERGHFVLHESSEKEPTHAAEPAPTVSDRGLPVEAQASPRPNPHDTERDARLERARLHNLRHTEHRNRTQSTQPRQVSQQHTQDLHSEPLIQPAPDHFQRQERQYDL
jgi:conjugative relaxase-like TrwC/TraI family protein